MRAVVRRNKQLVCDEIGELEPAQGQVLVKTLACGICGSDLHALHHMEHMIELGRRGESGADECLEKQPVRRALQPARHRRRKRPRV